jgi:hypothetical protein
MLLTVFIVLKAIQNLTSNGVEYIFESPIRCADFAVLADERLKHLGRFFDDENGCSDTEKLKIGLAKQSALNQHFFHYIKHLNVRIFIRFLPY